MKNTRNILAIDPGYLESAFVIFDGRRVIEKSIFRNHEIMEIIYENKYSIEFAAIEMVASYGM